MNLPVDNLLISFSLFAILFAILFAKCCFLFANGEQVANNVANRISYVLRVKTPQIKNCFGEQVGERLPLGAPLGGPVVMVANRIFREVDN